MRATRARRRGVVVAGAVVLAAAAATAWLRASDARCGTARGAALRELVSCRLRGSASACTALAARCEADDALAQDERFQRSEALLGAACALGDLAACREQAIRLRAGLGDRYDPLLAARADGAACDGGIAEACTALGIAVLDGVGLPEDQAPATSEVLARACDAGLSYACARQAWDIENGVEGATDPADAAARYARACFSNMPPPLVACFATARLLAATDPDGARRAVVRSYHVEEHDSRTGVEDGGWLRPRLFLRGLYSYARGCELGDRRACEARAHVAAVWAAYHVPVPTSQSTRVPPWGADEDAPEPSAPVQADTTYERDCAHAYSNRCLRGDEGAREACADGSRAACAGMRGEDAPGAARPLCDFGLTYMCWYLGGKDTALDVRTCDWGSPHACVEAAHDTGVAPADASLLLARACEARLAPACAELATRAGDRHTRRRLLFQACLAFDGSSCAALAADTPEPVRRLELLVSACLYDDARASGRGGPPPSCIDAARLFAGQGAAAPLVGSLVDAATIVIVRADPDSRDLAGAVTAQLCASPEARAYASIVLHCPPEPPGR